MFSRVDFENVKFLAPGPVGLLIFLVLIIIDY